MANRMVAVTGVPCSGKTTLSRRLGQLLDMKVVDLNSLIEEKQLYSGVDAERDTRTVDLGVLGECVTGVVSGDTILDGLMSHRLNATHALVLRCDPRVLRDRMRDRGYGGRKIMENLEAEYLGTQTQDRLVIKADELFEPVETESFPLDSGIDLKKGYFLNTDEAHLVFFVDDVDSVDLHRVGNFFAFQKDVFPGTTNVSVSRLVDDSSIRLRTYERASFHETLACGTGSLAAAWAARLEFDLKADRIRVISRGGEQFVLFKGEELFLIGPAESVFSGIMDITLED